MSIHTLAQQNLQALYRHHHAWLFRWLRWRLGDSADAADLAQDTFVRILVRPARRELDNLTQARSYLRVIADGLCVDLWRRRDVEQAWLQTLAAAPQALEPSPEQRMLVVEALMQVGRMLERLPPRAAQAFVMAQVDGVRYKDIAAELGVSERMVKKYIAQAMLECALFDDERAY